MFDNLRSAEKRLKSLMIYHPDSSEAIRIAAAVEEIKSHFTDEQLAEYEESKNPVLSLVEQRAKAAEELKRMEENKDSVSI